MMDAECDDRWTGAYDSIGNRVTSSEAGCEQADADDRTGVGDRELDTHGELIAEAGALHRGADAADERRGNRRLRRQRRI